MTFCLSTEYEFLITQRLVVQPREPNGHYLINRTEVDLLYLIVGTRNSTEDTEHLKHWDWTVVTSDRGS